MIEDVQDAYSRARILLHDHLQQLGALAAQKLRVHDVRVHLCLSKLYDLQQVFLVVDLERNASRQEFVHHHSQRPNIHFLIVAVAQQKFRRYVQRRSAEGLALVEGVVDWPAEVSNLGDAEGHDDVFGFEIAVDDAEPMKLVQSLTDAPHDGLPFVLPQLALDLEDVVKLSALAVLQQQVDVEPIMKNWVQFDDIDVIEKGLYFDFPDELLKESFLFDSLLLDDLHCQQKACLFVSELTRTYLAVYTLLNLPSPISLSSWKSETARFFLGVSVVVVDTVSLKSFRLI